MSTDNISLQPLQETLEQIQKRLQAAQHPEMRTLAEEKSRDQHLARHAAELICFNTPLASIATEALECLSEMIRQELQDRDLREPKKPLPEQPF